MVKKNLALPTLELKTLPGPDTIRRVELKNGITILVRENFSSPSVVVSGYIMGGSLEEPVEKAGLSEFMVSALMRGTKTRSFQEIYESIESIGATLSIGSGKHSSAYFGKSLAEDLDLILQLLSDVLRNPSFPEDQFDRLMAEKLTSLAIRDQNTGARAHLAFNELAYDGHPYGQPGDGFPETIRELAVKDLRAIHHKLIGPQGMVIVVVGGVSVDVVLDLVESIFADWQNAEQAVINPLPNLSPLEGIQRNEIKLEGKSQSDVVLGVPGPSRYEPDYLAAVLGNNILGRFGMMGRIGDSVRVKSGLAYYAASSLAGGPGPGAWRVVAGVNPENVERAIDLIITEIREFLRNGVTEEEITDNQANFIGSLPRQLESNEGVAGAIVHIERYGLGLDYYRRYPGLVAEITRDQIHTIANKFLDTENLAIGIAGP